ncbi:cytosine permease [Clostridium sp. AF15-17LB]|nr:cytosine permease [Clostridium sp. AF15-17LB]
MNKCPSGGYRLLSTDKMLNNKLGGLGMDSKQEKNSIFEEDAFRSVPQDERHGWWKTSFIWAGSSICVPTIMVGALMIKGLSFAEMVLAVIIGTVLLSAVFCLQGMEGTDTGLPTVVLARSAFGREGAGIIISFILATTLICWTGSDCQIAGESFIQILTLNNIHWNREATIIVLGIIMLTVSILGEKIISKLNIIAVPALILLCIYGMVTCLQDISFIELVKASPVEPISLAEGVAMVFGMQAVGSTISPDYHRFCRDRKGSCLAAVVGIIPYCLFLFIAGSVMGAATGESDISVLIAKLGLPIIGLIILVLATWTTMACDAYTGGLAITSLLHLSGKKRAAATAVAGIVGILLAVFGIMNYFTNFLDLMASCIPPVAGVMITDYWLLKHGKVGNWEERPGFHWNGIICLVCGVLAALFLPFGFPTINGILVSGILYFLTMKLTSPAATQS